MTSIKKEPFLCVTRRALFKAAAIAGISGLSTLTSVADASEKKSGISFILRNRKALKKVSGHADTLLLGTIITMDENKPIARAMTLKNGLIQYVGSERVARSLCNESTQVLDYKKHFIYPGFLEAHAHGSLVAWRQFDQADLSEGASYKDYVDTMRQFIAKHPNQRFYLGSGWIWRDKDPDKNLLDAVSSTIPIVMQSIDGHSLWLNSKAIEFLKITRSYAKKWGKNLVRVDASGNLTGYIRENPALELVRRLPVSVGKFKDYIRYWQDYCFARGFTGACEAGVELFHPNVAKGYIELAKEKALKLRTYSYHLIDETRLNPIKDVDYTVTFAQKNNSEFFKTIGLKVFNDGVVEAHTAWLIDEYCDEKGYYGLKRTTDLKAMTDLMTVASRYGLSVHSHSFGDGATRFQLDAIEASAKITGNYDQRHCLAHLSLVNPADRQRMADLNAIAVVAPIWSPRMPDFEKQEQGYLGKERAGDNYPIKSFFDAGAVTTFHSDFPVGGLMSAPGSIYSAIARKLPELGDEWVGNAKEAITRQQALEALTKNVAYLWREEDRMGTLTIGKLANICIWDTDFLKAPLDTLLEAQCVATLVDGKFVFRAKSEG